MLLLKVTPRTFIVVSRSTSGSSGGGEFTTPAAVVAYDFFRLELVQLQVVCGRPRYNIAKFGGACVSTFSRDNEVRVVSKLEESVAGMKRLGVSGCDSIGRWSYILDPLIMLSVIDLVDDTSLLYTVRCACPVKDATSQ